MLHDVPLEDVWAVELPGGGAGRTVQDVRVAFVAGVAAAPSIVKGLFRLRGWIGLLFRWDRQRPAWGTESYVDRLLLYRFRNEQLTERRNATVHAFSSLSIRPMPDGYLAYWAIYVQPVNRFASLYMRAIRPFRRLIVYPAVIRSVRNAWAERYGGEPVASVASGADERGEIG